jgi:hypothetical protein
VLRETRLAYSSAVRPVSGAGLKLFNFFPQCWGSRSACLGLPDPDPDSLVSGTDPAPDPSLFSEMC